MAHPTVRIRRTLPFPRERVYRAWLDPATVSRWMAPEGFGVARAEVDERVGGRHQVWHADADGRPLGGVDSEILELTAPERIVLALRFGEPGGQEATPETRLTLTFSEPAPGETELVLVHERLDELAAARPEVAEGVGGGWGQALDKLAKALAKVPAKDMTTEVEQ